MAQSETDGGYSHFESEKEGEGDYSTVKKTSVKVVTTKESKAEEQGYTSIDDEEDNLENEVEKQFKQSVKAASIHSSIKSDSQVNKVSKQKEEDKE